ncbi:MAG: CopG family transcriptional regulator [Thermoanaerobaculia bacterium]
MTRVQILLSEDQDRHLERLAAERGQSKASLVRQALDLLFRTEPAGDEPLLGLIGQAGRAGRGDVSRVHDRILSDEARRRHRHP